MERYVVAMVFLFLLPSPGVGQELEWERWGEGLGQGEVVRVGDMLYSFGEFKQGIGHEPRATITRHGINPGEEDQVVKTDIIRSLRGIVPDRDDFFWGLQGYGDLYRIDAVTGSSNRVAWSDTSGIPSLYPALLVRSGEGRLYYMNPNLMEIDPETGAYRTLSGFDPGQHVTVRPFGLATLSDGGVVAAFHVRTRIVHEFSEEVLDTLAVMFVRPDGDLVGPVEIPRDGLKVGEFICMNDMPNGDLLLSVRLHEDSVAGRMTYPLSRIVHYRFTVEGEMVERHIWRLDRLWNVADLAIAENGELIAVGTRNRGNHGTSSLLFRADLDGNVLWSRDETEFLYGVAQLDRVFRWNDGRFLVSGTTNYLHPDGNYYGSWMGLFDLKVESGVSSEGETTVPLDLR